MVADVANVANGNAYVQQQPNDGGVKAMRGLSLRQQHQDHQNPAYYAFCENSENTKAIAVAALQQPIQYNDTNGRTAGREAASKCLILVVAI